MAEKLAWQDEQYPPPSPESPEKKPGQKTTKDEKEYRPSKKDDPDVLPTLRQQPSRDSRLKGKRTD